MIKEIYAMRSHQNTIIRLCLGIRGMGERVTQPELCVLKQNGSFSKQNEGTITK